MESQDKTIVCFDCKKNFVFGVEEQQSFRAKGHNHAPKRCPECRGVRAARKADRPSERDKYPAFIPNNNAVRQMYPVTCSQCSKETQVPFEPRAGRPVYCSDCYHKSRNAAK